MKKGKRVVKAIAPCFLVLALQACATMDARPTQAADASSPDLDAAAMAWGMADAMAASDEEISPQVTVFAEAMARAVTEAIQRSERVEPRSAGRNEERSTTAVARPVPN